ALFLKLVSGAIRTIAISASAMVGDALVCFRTGTTNLLWGRRLLQQEYRFIFGIPNARMSSCPCFQHFPPLPCLDNSASGIPNAIPPVVGRPDPIPRQARESAFLPVTGNTD